jgi:hypothetical protein
VITSIAAAAPQLPAPSRARTQRRTIPFATLAVGSGVEACTVPVPNVPDMATPEPAGAGAGPVEYSAAATTPPPRSTSLNVA